MAYRIDYTSGGERRPISKAGGRIFSGFLLGVAAFCAIYALTHRNALLYFLIPGEAEVTIAAGKELIGQLQQGQSIGEAVAAFCQEILQGAYGG